MRGTAQEAPGKLCKKFQGQFRYSFNLVSIMTCVCGGEGTAQEAPAPFSIESNRDFIRKGEGNCT